MAKYQVQTHLSTQKTDPLRDFKFVVNIPHEVNINGSTTKIGFTLGFTSVDGLSASTNAIPYRSGNLNTTTQMIPGQTTFNPLNLQRGLLLGTAQDFQWFQQIFSVQIGDGQYVSNNQRGFRTNVYVHVLPHPRTDTSVLDAVATFKVYNAWPSSISYSTLNAGDNGLIVSQLTLAHEGWELLSLASPSEPFGPDLSV